MWSDSLRQARHGLPDQSRVQVASVCRQGTPTSSTVARALRGHHHSWCAAGGRRGLKAVQEEERLARLATVAF